MSVLGARLDRLVWMVDWVLGHQGRWVFLAGLGFFFLSACGGGGSDGGSSSGNGNTESGNTVVTQRVVTEMSAGGTVTGVTSGDLGQDNLTSAGAGTTTALSASQTEIRFTKEGENYYSPPLSLDISSVAAQGDNRASVRTNSGPVSFLLHLTGTAVGDSGVSFHSVVDPKGKAINMDFQPCNEHYCGVLVPRTPAMIGVSGKWVMRLRSTLANPGDFKLYTTVRSSLPLEESPKIIVAPYVTGTRFKDADLSAALAHLVSIYSENKISVELRKLTRLTESRFAVIDLDFTNKTTVELVSRGATDAVNVFLVEDFNDYGALGIAAGIPGSMGLEGGHNGILIGISSHRVGGVLDTTFLGETVAHEMGHFLGLFHASESTGSPHDPLDDTPECLSDRDVNGSGSLEVEECAGFGAENLMFWTPFASWGNRRISQSVLTPDQRTVIRYSPIAQ